MFSLFLSMLIVKAHRLISLGILYMSNSAFESYYSIFNYSSLNCSGFNYKVHITTESSASSFNLLWSRTDGKCGFVLDWGEIREGSAFHVTGSEL